MHELLHDKLVDNKADNNINITDFLSLKFKKLKILNKRKLQYMPCDSQTVLGRDIWV